MKKIKNPYAYFDLSELDLVNNPEIITHILLSEDENLKYMLESEIARVKGKIDSLKLRLSGIYDNIFDCGYSIRDSGKVSHPIEIYDFLKENERIVQEREERRNLIKLDAKKYKKSVSHKLYKENDK